MAEGPAGFCRRCRRSRVVCSFSGCGVGCPLRDTGLVARAGWPNGEVGLPAEARHGVAVNSGRALGTRPFLTIVFSALLCYITFFYPISFAPCQKRERVHEGKEVLQRLVSAPDTHCSLARFAPRAGEAQAVRWLLGASGERQCLWRSILGSATIQGQLWGARAHDWATSVEQMGLPLFGAALAAARVTSGTRLLDAGCGAGLLALLASLRGA